MESEANSFRVEFPDFSCSILQKLNQQRQRGQLCDITVVIQGRHYRAHRAVLAASSPYFCDQVLLKNSMRVVLPDVMHPCVFESLLQSCYTGSLQLPVGEVVGFLTAASFLQMWHVVDKCTELLGGSPAVLCHRSGSGSDHLSPGEDSASEGLDLDTTAGQAEFSKACGGRDGELDQPVDENSFSPQGLGQCAAPGSPRSAEQGQSCADPDGQDGGGDEAEYQYARPAYIQPSIMSHKRWIQVKAERMEQEGCHGFSGVGATEEPEGSDMGLQNRTEDHSQLGGAGSPFGADLEEKLGAKPGQSRGKGQGYEESLDFYGASMDEFTGDHGAGPLDNDALDEDPERDAGGGGGGEDAADPAGGAQEDTSHAGFSSGYKLYPCQCGKSFTHKSQRDRHMSMHLGLRPYGCAVCGKRFKMKHHLVGHVKIHTGIKPYECSVCSKRFMWRDSFNRHVSSCTRSHQARRAVAEQPTQIC
ncbi:zinc finger and BTB domain-containing protein 43-like [Megalops cyprinoides]|uniref:zinc finger and BTB domain-containing protein 43-like n=1 Tax=Megalops cyprinoides TaxID=118141 RepID=UPI001864AF9C|nr:zinc finger and BTB domain-containing protein 43-like [Megalops cyprinoides]